MEICNPEKVTFVCEYLTYANFYLSSLTDDSLKLFSSIFPKIEHLILNQCKFLTPRYPKSIIGLSRLTQLQVSSAASSIPSSIEDTEALLQSLPNIIILEDFRFPSSDCLLLMLKYCPKISRISTKISVCFFVDG